MLAILLACSKKISDSGSEDTVAAAGSSAMVRRPVVNQPGKASMIPQATAFKINPEYADKVGVTFGADGRLSYFPAPTDITPSSAPLDLGNGWWLNRQGISANSVFTRYTFDEYRKLPAVPSPGQIKEAVIPGSGVTEMVKLPYNINDTQSHLEEIKEYLDSL